MTQPPNTRQYSIRSLLALFFSVALILAANRWLGPIYGWITAVPCGIVLILTLLTSYRVLIGGAIVAVLFVVLYLYVTQGGAGFDPRKATLAVGAYGAAIGGSLHAIWYRPAVGIAALATNGLILLYVVQS